MHATGISLVHAALDRSIDRFVAIERGKLEKWRNRELQRGGGFRVVVRHRRIGAAVSGPAVWRALARRSTLRNESRVAAADFELRRARNASLDGAAAMLKSAVLPSLPAARLDPAVLQLRATGRQQARPCRRRQPGLYCPMEGRCTVERSGKVFRLRVRRGEDGRVGGAGSIRGMMRLR